MANYLVTDTELTDVADVIREKGGTSAALEWPDGFVDAIGDISGGGGTGGGSIADPIRFFDYDGTCVASYKAVPSALPENPSHDGLVAQGWNYTLAQIQTQFAATGTCDVGQMYVTESGDTEIDIVLQGGRLSPYLSICPNGTAEIDWGDGSSTDTVTGTSITETVRTQHTYSSGGKYTISVHVVSGSVGFYGGSDYGTLLNANASSNTNYVYSSCITAIRLGLGITSIGERALVACYSLKSITMPTSFTTIGATAFKYCYSLECVIFPSSINSIGNSAFYESCYGLKHVSIPQIPSSKMGTAVFRNCYSLSSVTLPSTFTSLPSYTLSTCRSLSRLTIPAGITSLATYSLYYCAGLAELHFRRATPPSLGNTNALSGLPTDCKIYVPAGSLSAYTSSSSYPSSSTYTYIEE